VVILRRIERTVVVVLIALSLAIPLSIFAAGNSVLDPDVAVTNEVQDVDTPVTNPAVAFLNELGRAPMLLAVASAVSALLLYTGRRKDALFAIAPLAIAQALNFGLKTILSSPRPTGDHVSVSEYASGFGFPSGHTMATFVLVGSLVFILLRGVSCQWRRSFVLGAAVVVMLGMGFSRIHVGAHWPSDVLGAYLWGTVFVTLSVMAYGAIRLDSTRPAVR
jgi:undecaprenyl-diphosphatase